MAASDLDRRGFLKGAGAVTAASFLTGSFARSATALAAAAERIPRSSVRPFPLAQVELLDSPYRDNMQRVVEYLRFLDLDRLLHTFRVNVGLPSTAEPVGGWEAPTGELRGHTLGHVLSALALLHANTGDEELRDKGAQLVAELAKCQAASPDRGFNAGYLSAFPEEFIDRVESAPPIWAPYYTLHKIAAGLLDQHRLCGNEQALAVLTRFAAWCHARNRRLSDSHRQQMLRTEFGGMNEVFADLYGVTGEAEHLELARMFDHEVIYAPLAAGRDALAGYHANAQIPKILGAIKEYHHTGIRRYREIAETFWSIVVDHHTYINGGNSNAEWFQSPGIIAGHLSTDTAESCNTYNMLKLTRELFFLAPERADYMDYYEWALINHILGAQNPDAPRHQHSYYTPLLPGGIKTYSDDYDSFTCCHGTGLESHAKFADSIYFHDGDRTLYVNLFIPSKVDWPGRLKLRQETGYPAEPRTRLVVVRGGSAGLAIRVPGWGKQAATLRINGRPRRVPVEPGTYLTLPRRQWRAGDTVELSLPMALELRPTPDEPAVQAVTYGPVVLAGRYGTREPARLPKLDPGSLRQDAEDPLTFHARAGGAGVTLTPFYALHGQRYTVYWQVGERAPAPRPPELVVHYAFDEADPAVYTARDVSGRTDVELTAGLNGPGNSPACSKVPGRRGRRAVYLGGNGGYVLLPVGLLAELRETTLASWVRLDSNPAGARVFEFASDDATSMYLTPRTEAGTMRFAVVTGDPAREASVEAPSLPTGAWKHVVVTLAGPDGARLYVDGVEVAHEPGLDRLPVDLGNAGSFLHRGATLYNRLGRSLEGDIPYLHGAIDDFRIYGRALSAEAVRALYEE